MATKVRREDGKVWIETVKGFSPSDYRSSVHGSQAANSERRQKQIARLERARQPDFLAVQAISRSLDTLEQTNAEPTVYVKKIEQPLN